jgi:multidrug resistance efflux pump
VYRCAVTSPLAGEVIEVLKHAGEWVNAGDPVVHVVRLDTLRVEGFVNAAEHSPASVRDRPVRVSVTVGPGETAEFTGRVVFVRPTLQAGEQYLIYADVENRSANGQWLLQPGMLASMRIETTLTVQSPSPARSTHASR